MKLTTKLFIDHPQFSFAIRIRQTGILISHHKDGIKQYLALALGKQNGLISGHIQCTITLETV